MAAAVAESPLRQNRSMSSHITTPAAGAPVRVALLMISLLVLPAQAAAQSPVVSSRAAAMGDVAYDALACGPDALAGNPAALARLCDAPVRMILLPTLALEGAGNSAGGQVWRHRRALLDALDRGSFAAAFEPAVREAILASIPPEGYRHRTRLHLPVAQAGLGDRSAFSLSFTAENHGRIARDLAELALRGYEDGRISYGIQGTDEHATGFWTLAVGHGRGHRGTDFGITARLISGTFLTRWQAFDPVVDVSQQRVTGTMIGAFAGDNLFTGNLFDFRPPDGFGWGIDLGAIRDVGRARLGVAIQNALSRMTWSDESHLRIMTLEATAEGAAFRTEDAVYDPATATAPERQVAAALRDDAHFPRRIRASGLFSPSPRASLGAGAAFNVGSGALGRDWDRRFSLGGEVRPLPYLRFHGGASSDLGGASELSSGLELDIFRTRFGVSAARIAEPGEQPGWDAMGGWRIIAGFSRF
jgi:hypothetical protein